MTSFLLHPVKHILLLLSLCFSITAIAQNEVKEEEEEADDTDSSQLTTIKEQKPEIFTSGFIDIFNNGQVNASARFLRLYIGEPGRFALPLSFYSGVSSNNFESQSTASYG